MVERKKLARRFSVILVTVGFAILLINAIDYLGGFFGLSSDIKLPSSGIGVIFLVTGWVQIPYTQHAKSRQDLAGGD